MQSLNDFGRFGIVFFHPVLKEARSTEKNGEISGKKTMLSKEFGWLLRDPGV
jgi:hypothetical protein